MSTPTTTYTTRPIASLRPYARNARTHSPEQVRQIAASIREFGFTNPLLITPDGDLIAGHGRLEAARSIGLAEVPCVEVSGLTEAQRRALILADNRLALNAGWDEDLLRIELAELKGMDYSLDVIGFDDVELSALLNPGTPAGLTDPDDVPPVQAEAITRPGDVWLLGQHRLMCGSSLVSAEVDVLMSGQLADLLLTDPPYGVSYAEKNKFLNAIARGNHIQEPINNDHKSADEMNEFWRDCLDISRNVCSDSASYYIFSPQGGDLMMMMMMSIKSARWQLKHMLVWVKNNHVLGRCDYHYKHEPIFYGWKEGGTHKFYGGSSCFSVFHHDKPLKNDIHPTMKPVGLCADLICNSTLAGNLIYEPFSGSGTTLIAAEQTGRRCYAMELSPHYVDVSVRRWQNYTGQRAVLESTGEPFPEPPCP